jgi:hypothetical protein
MMQRGNTMASLRSPKLPVSTRPSAPRGRPFARGNPGRKPGSRNRTTVAAATLLEGEAEALTRKAVEFAKAGDRDMLKFLLGRILPRERRVKLDLPRLEFADDAVTALGHIADALAAGEITPSEAAAVAQFIEVQRRVIDQAEIERRFAAIEAKLRSPQT